MSSLLRKRDQAVPQVLARLRRDLEGAEDPSVRKFLRYLEEVLFEQDLTVTQAYRACQLRPRQFVPHFRNVMDTSPKDYVQELRVEAGRLLLIKTQMKMAEIADLTGFSSGQAFGAAFLKLVRIRPSIYRTRFQAEEPGHSDGMDRLFDRVSSGKLDFKTASSLFTHLHQQYPELFHPSQHLAFDPTNSGSPRPNTIGVSRDDIHRLNAEAFWYEISGLTEAEQRSRIWQVNQQHPALFQLLLEKTLTEGRENRHRGLRIARLAVDAAMVAQKLDNQARSEVWARAWAHLGNAYRLVFDLTEAERAFQFAEGFLPKDSRREIVGEILDLKATLFWYQGKLQEGIRLEDRAIPLLESKNDPEAVPRALLTRGILYRSDGDLLAAIDDFEAAQRRLETTANNPELTFTLKHITALCYWELDRPEEVGVILSELKAFVASGAYKRFSLYIDWFEGRLALDSAEMDKALDLLERAHNGFLAAESNMASFVGLDMAIGYFQTNQAEKSIQLVNQARPALNVMKRHAPFEKVYARIERSVANRMITVEDLIEVRDLSVRFSSSPASRQLLEQKGLI